MSERASQPVIPERLGTPRAAAGANRAFREALTESLSALPTRDRNLVHFYYFHGLTHDRLAAMFHIRRSAVLRDLSRIRERVLVETRRLLALRLPFDATDLDHVIECARGRFDLTISQVLRT